MVKKLTKEDVSFLNKFDGFTMSESDAFYDYPGVGDIWDWLAVEVTPEGLSDAKRRFYNVMVVNERNKIQIGFVDGKKVVFSVPDEFETIEDSMSAVFEHMEGINRKIKRQMGLIDALTGLVNAMTEIAEEANENV